MSFTPHAWHTDNLDYVGSSSCDVAAQEDCNNIPILVGAIFLHASGVAQVDMMPQQTMANVRKVFAPKVDCMINHLANKPCLKAIHSIVVFSSISAVLGDSGLVHYAAANAALDSWSARRIAEGMHIPSIQWGAWSGVGMATTSDAIISRMNALGWGVVNPIAGLHTMADMLGNIGTMCCFPYSC